MIRQVCGPTLNPAEVHPDLAAHQAEMIARCPYLGPSVERELTVWFAYSAEPWDQPDLLDLLVGYAEQVRAARRLHGPLVCRNVALLGPADARSAKDLMEMPVWLARNLYAPVQIIVDRFWIGSGRRPGRGRSAMHRVPVSYFMIRCGIAHHDRVIVSDRPCAEIEALRAGPGDDGRDVLGQNLGMAADTGTWWDGLQAAYPLTRVST